MQRFQIGVVVRLISLCKLEVQFEHQNSFARRHQVSWSRIHGPLGSLVCFSTVKFTQNVQDTKWRIWCLPILITYTKTFKSHKTKEISKKVSNKFSCFYSIVFKYQQGKGIFINIEDFSCFFEVNFQVVGLDLFSTIEGLISSSS